MKKGFSLVIKDIRAKLKLTQKELGNLFDPPIKQQSINGWEKGDCVPNQKYWSKIAELAKMELSELYSYVNKIDNYAQNPDIFSAFIQEVDNFDSQQVEKLIQILADKNKTNKSLDSLIIAMLLSGANNWNSWRELNSNQTLNINDLDLNKIGAINFDNYNLTNVNMSGCIGSNISFYRADLSNCNLTNTNFNKCSFIKASLENSIFENSILTDCNLSKAFAYNANFTNAKLNHCDLTLATFVQANFINTSIINCDIDKSNFIKTDLSFIGNSNNIKVSDKLAFDNLEKAVIYLLHHL